MKVHGCSVIISPPFGVLDFDLNNVCIGFDHGRL